jgi:archaeal preflagellin peptidase FlaK
LVGLDEAVLATGAVLLLVGFGYAAFADLRDREVSDALWQVLGIAGVVLGLVALAPGGAVPLVLWVAVAGLTLEHMFAWDERLGPGLERHADLFELGAYVGVVALVLVALASFGLGPSGVPVSVVAVLVSVVFARALFEAGVLYGGADAKALMIAGLLVPMFPAPLLLTSPGPLTVPEVLPFSLNLLMNAALFSIAIPIAIAVRNIGRREFEFPRGFTGFWIPVEELPDRYVWVRDPAYPTSREEEEEMETSEEDRRHRQAIAEELERRGVRRVWVTPQVPFLVLMALGALAALLAGNLVVDLIQAL